MKQTILFPFLLAIVLHCVVMGQQVGVRKGNVFCFNQNGTITELTHMGTDTLAVVCPEKQLVAFIRQQSDSLHEVWTMKVDGSVPQLVLREHASDMPEHNMTGIDTLLFSLDCMKLYISTEAWAISPAVHEIDLETHRDRFLSAGSIESVISKGEYKGFLIVQKHKYFVGGGSYDWYWVVDPRSGEEVGPIGEATDYFYQMLKK